MGDNKHEKRKEECAVYYTIRREPTRKTRGDTGEARAELKDSDSDRG